MFFGSATLPPGNELPTSIAQLPLQQRNGRWQKNDIDIHFFLFRLPSRIGRQGISWFVFRIASKVIKGRRRNDNLLYTECFIVEMNRKLDVSGSKAPRELQVMGPDVSGIFGQNDVTRGVRRCESTTHRGFDWLWLSGPSPGNAIVAIPRSACSWAFSSLELR